MDFDNVLELLNELSINKHRNSKNGNEKNAKSQQKEKKEKINKTEILCEMPYEIKDNKINFQSQSGKELNLEVEEIIICTDCKSYRIKELDGYYTCLDCGLKNEIIIDSGQEWRYYGSDDNKSDPSRCDIPTNELLPCASMGSMIGYGIKETATTKRIRNINNWYSMSYKDHSLMETFNNITIMAVNSGINQCIIEEAKYMYKIVADIKSSRRTKKEGMKAGSLFLACKLKGCPRNCDEIAKICHIKNNKTLRKSIKTFEEIWNNIQNANKLQQNQYINQIVNNKQINVINCNFNDSNTGNDINYVITYENKFNNDYNNIDGSNISDYNDNVDNAGNVGNVDNAGNVIGDDTNVSANININSSNSNTIDEDDELNLEKIITQLHRFISIMGFDDNVFETCKKILIFTEKENYLEKHNPLSRLSGIIYYVNERYKLKINKKQIMKICNVSEVTINKCYQRILTFKTNIDHLMLI